MRPCLLIQYRIALRRNKVNPTPCASLVSALAAGSTCSESMFRTDWPWPNRSCGPPDGSVPRAAKGIVASVRCDERSSAPLQSRSASVRGYLDAVLLAVSRTRMDPKNTIKFCPSPPFELPTIPHLRSSPRPRRYVLRSQAIPPSRDSDSPNPGSRHRRRGPGLAARAAATA